MSRSDRRVSRAVREASRLMPDNGDLTGLVANLAAARNRRILVVANAFPSGGPSGLLIDMPTTDLILVDEPSSPSRRAGIICHEVAHMLLRHDGDLQQSALISEAAPNLSPELIRRALARHSYDDEKESEAELTATIIGAECARRQGRERQNSDRDSIASRLL